MIKLLILLPSLLLQVVDQQRIVLFIMLVGKASTWPTESARATS